MMNGIGRRDALMAGAGLAAGAVLPGGKVASQPAPDSQVTKFDYISLVYPDLRDEARRLLGEPPLFLSQARLPKLRQGLLSRQPWLPDVPVSKQRVPGLAKAPDVTIYVINAKPGLGRPGILHTHGGGFVLGDAAMMVPILKELAIELECVIISVDYRLAPETTYSGSVDDNYAGLRWMYTNAELLGLDPARIAVMGESAGGGHAALLSIAARDRGEVPIKFQALISPMMDDRTGTTRPTPAHLGVIGWTPAANRFGWASFLGLEPGSAGVPVAGVPARVAGVCGLPPAFISVGALDLFVMESVEYAQRLTEAAIPVELLVVPGVWHGADAANTSRSSVVLRNAKIEALRRALGG